MKLRPESLACSLPGPVSTASFAPDLKHSAGTDPAQPQGCQRQGQASRTSVLGHTHQTWLQWTAHCCRPPEVLRQSSPAQAPPASSESELTGRQAGRQADLQCAGAGAGDGGARRAAGLEQACAQEIHQRHLLAQLLPLNDVKHQEEGWLACVLPLSLAYCDALHVSCCTQPLCLQTMDCKRALSVTIRHLSMLICPPAHSLALQVRFCVHPLCLQDAWLKLKEAHITGWGKTVPWRRLWAAHRQSHSAPS